MNNKANNANINVLSNNTSPQAAFMLPYILSLRIHANTFILIIVCSCVLISACYKPINSKFKLVSTGIIAAATSQTNDILITANKSGGASLWHTNPFKKIADLNHQQNPKLVSVAISPNSKYAITATQGKVIVWDINNTTTLLKINTNYPVTSIDIANNGNLVIGLAAHFAESYKKTGELIGTLNHDKLINKVAISSDGKYVVTASDDNLAKLWDLQNQKKLFNFKHDKYVTFVAISPSNKYVLTSSAQHDSFLWDLKTGEQLQEIHLGHAHLSIFQQKLLTITAAKFNQQEELIYLGTPPRFIRVWSIAKQKFIDYDIIPSEISFKNSPTLIYALSLATEKNVTAITANGLGFNFNIE